jgi:hypothetical protein
VLSGTESGYLFAPAGPARRRPTILHIGSYDGTAEELYASAGPALERGYAFAPAADDQFNSLLTLPALKALLAPRMQTHGVSSVRAYFADMLRYTNAGSVSSVTCPSYVTDNEFDPVSTGQGKELFDHLTCPRQFRLLTRAEGAEGHCEGMAPIVFWTAAFDWLDHTIA